MPKVVVHRPFCDRWKPEVKHEAWRPSSWKVGIRVGNLCTDLMDIFVTGTDSGRWGQNAEQATRERTSAAKLRKA